MSALPTCLLRHQRESDLHYDWLLMEPDKAHDPQARLWTARVAIPSTDWLAAGQFELTPIQPHRQIYLTYQGPIAGNRGTVQRVDEGTFTTLLWQANRRVIDLAMQHVTGRLELLRQDDERWLARFSPLAA